MSNPETIEIHGLKTIHKLCNFAADRSMEGSTFTEIVERMFNELEKSNICKIPEGFLLVQKKNTEDWYLDEDEGLWLEHDGIDGTLSELSIGEVKPVQHKEYLITQSRTLYAAKVWNHNDDHIAWQLFEDEAVAKRAADWCKKMYEVIDTGGSGIKYQIQPVELPENLFNWFHPDIELFDTIEEGAEAYTKEQWEQLKVNLGVEIEPQILDYDDIPNIPDDAIVWSNWKPEPPEDGLFLIAAFDSENGPVLWWANPKQGV